MVHSDAAVQVCGVRSGHGSGGERFQIGLYTTLTVLVACTAQHKRQKAEDTHTDDFNAIVFFITEYLCFSIKAKSVRQHNVKKNENICHRSSAFYRELCTTHWQRNNQVGKWLNPITKTEFTLSIFCSAFHTGKEIGNGF